MFTINCRFEIGSRQPNMECSTSQNSSAENVSSVRVQNQMVLNSLLQTKHERKSMRVVSIVERERRVLKGVKDLINKSQNGTQKIAWTNIKLQFVSFATIGLFSFATIGLFLAFFRVLHVRFDVTPVNCSF